MEKHQTYSLQISSLVSLKRHTIKVAISFCVVLSSVVTTKSQPAWTLVDSINNMWYAELDGFNRWNCAAIGDSDIYVVVRVTEDAWETSEWIIVDSMRNSLDPDGYHEVGRFRSLAYPARDRLFTIELKERLLLRSTDLGISWDTTSFLSQFDSPVYSIEMLNRDTGYIRGSEDMFCTKDGGETWIRIPIPDRSPMLIRDVSFIHPDSIVVLVGRGDSNRVMSSLDGGAHWTVSAAPYHIRTISFSNSATGWAVGRNRTHKIFELGFDIIYKTVDGGLTWEEQLNSWTDPPYGLSHVSAVSATAAYAAGPRGKLYSTTDGGTTWVHHPSPVDTASAPDILDLVAFPDGWTYMTALFFRIGTMQLRTASAGDDRLLNSERSSVIDYLSARAGESIRLVPELKQRGVPTARPAIYTVTGIRLPIEDRSTADRQDIQAPHIPGFYLMVLQDPKTGERIVCRLLVRP